MRDLYKEIGDVLGGGTDYAIVPMADKTYESAAATTVVTTGAGAGDNLTWTYITARTSFTDPTDYIRNSYHTPSIRFDGSTEHVYGVDADFWSSGDGVNDSAMSIGIWLKVPESPTALQQLFSKDGNTAGREWFLRYNATGTGYDFVMRDVSASVSTVVASSALQPGVWQHIVVTYDGAGGATAGNTVSIYVNAVESSTPTNNASYVAMENGGARPMIMARNATEGSTGGNAWAVGRVLGGPCGPFLTKKELTATQVLRLFEIGRAAQEPTAPHAFIV